MPLPSNKVLLDKYVHSMLNSLSTGFLLKSWWNRVFSNRFYVDEMTILKSMHDQAVNI